MKKKLPIDQEIYLPEYFSGTVAGSFDKESDQRILYWDFSKELDEKHKMQTALLLNEIVKSIKNREERRNRYLLPLKCLFCYAEKSGLKHIMKMEKAQEQEYSLMLKREYGNSCSSPEKFILFCRKLLFLGSKNINWEANVWFTERRTIRIQHTYIKAHPAYYRYKKGQLFLLRNADFYYKDENSWMKVPDTTRSIPISDILHWLILRYSDRNHIPVENVLFLNNGKRFTAEGFQNAIMKQCRKSGILTDVYVFKGNGYQKEVCKAFYRSGASIQVIRDYMGYQTDEIVKKNIGLLDEELVKKSMEYYAKMESSLGGNLQRFLLQK